VRQHSAQRPALFARAGLVADAKQGMETAVPLAHGEGLANVTRGLIAARERDHETAIASLRRGIELLRFTGEPEYFLAVEALASFWRRRGERDRADRLLNDAAAQRARTYGLPHWTGAYWIKLNADLLSTCRKQGRHDEANRVGATLRAVLQDADVQHPAARMIRSPAGR
jgi:hypothetical protein